MRRALDSLFWGVVDPALWVEDPLSWRAALPALTDAGSESDPGTPVCSATSSERGGTSKESFDLDQHPSFSGMLQLYLAPTRSRYTGFGVELGEIDGFPPPSETPPCTLLMEGGVAWTAMWPGYHCHVLWVGTSLAVV